MPEQNVAVALPRSFLGNTRTALALATLLIGGLANAAWILLLCWKVYGIIADQM